MENPKVLKECTCIAGYRDDDEYVVCLSFSDPSARDEIFNWLDELIGKDEDQHEFVKRLAPKDS